MGRFLIDEDMPRSTGSTLASAGHEVLDVRDSGLRGRGDKEVFDFAQRSAATILTGDIGLRISISIRWGHIMALWWSIFRMSFQCPR